MAPGKRVVRGGRVALLAIPLMIVLFGAHADPAFAGPATDQHSSHPVVAAQRHAAAYALALPRLLLNPIGVSDASATAKVVTHFPFQSARSADGMIVVSYYHEPASFAQQLIALAQGDLVHPIHDTLGYSLKRPVNIYVFASRTDFLAGAPVTDAAETEALADPASSSVYLVSNDAQDNGATDDLPHELTHIVFHQNEDAGHLEGNYFSMCPIWLDEGLAAFDEPVPSAAVQDYSTALNQAVDSRVLVDFLRDFNVSYPPDPDTDFLAYAEARSFIAYLANTYGFDTLHRFLAGARDGDLNFDALITFGADLRLLQSRWETSLGLPPTVPDQGFAPYVPPVQPFQHGTLRGLASATRAFLVWSGDMIADVWLAALVLLTLWSLLVLSLEVRRTRRPRPLGPMPDPLPLSASEPADWAPELAPCIAPPIEPYLPVLPTDALASMPIAAAPATVATVPTVPTVPTAPTVTVLGSRQRSHPPRWFDVLLLALPLPLAVGVAALHIWLDPLHVWFAAYVSAALVGVVFCAAFICLEIAGRVRRRVVRVRRAGMIVAALLVVGSGLSATPIGRAQAQGYEARGAYAMALRVYAGAGESQRDALNDTIRVQVEWAETAAAVDDFVTATAHLRAAIALDSRSSATASARTVLVMTTKTWAQDLAGEHHYAEAAQVYGDELGSPSCDSSCAAALTVGLDDVYIAWAGPLAENGDYAAAAAKLQLVVDSTADPATAAVARQDMLEVQATQALETALAAGAAGNIGAMNAQLHSLVARYPHAAATSEVVEAPQPVTGSVMDARGVSVEGDRLFFLAFAAQGPAQSFHFDFGHDTSAFKAATTIGANGTFSVRLPPGYWYVACWDDPTMAFNDYFNAPLASDNAAFTVQPFTPASVGVIMGY